MADPIKHSIHTALQESREIPLDDLRRLSSADTASLLMDLPSAEKRRLFEELLKAGLAPSVLSEMPEPRLKAFLQSLPEKHLIALFSKGQMDDLVYLIDFIEDKTLFLEKLSEKQKIKLKNFMNYPEGSSGRIMQDDFFSVAIETTAGEGIEKLREYS